MKSSKSNLLALLSLFFCLSGAALWFESYQKTLKLSFPRGAFEAVDGNDYPEGRNRQFGIDSYMGRVHFIASKNRAWGQNSTGDYGKPDGILCDHYELPVMVWDFLGFAWFDGYEDVSPIATGEPLWRYRSLVIPYWFITSVFAIPVLAWLIVQFRTVRRQRSLQNGCCPTCGYDLRATPDRCPECGNRPKT